MADNITITEGTAKAIAADDVSSVWYQTIKLDRGVGGSSNLFTGTIDELSVLADGTVAIGSFDADLPGGTVDIIASGTIKSVQGGTIGNLASGSVVITDGTISGFGEIGTINVLEDGTVAKVGTVTGMGVLALGTVKVTEGSTVLKSGTITTQLAGTQELLGTVNYVGTVGHLGGGTADLVTRVGNLGTTENINKGTITKLEGGTVGNLASGSVVVTVGTTNINTGTVALLTRAGNLGTVENVNAGTITRLGGGSVVVTASTVTTQLAGTQQLLGTTNKVGTVDVLTAGTITRVQGGTIGNLASGSVVVTVGTIANVVGGTVQVNPKSPIYVTTYGTMFAGAGSAWGTLSAASGAGTYHYVSGADIVVKSGTVDAVLSYGSVLNGTGVILRGSFPEGGGISKIFSPALRSSGTNSELMCEIAGAGTVEFKAEFWRGT